MAQLKNNSGRARTAIIAMSFFFGISIISILVELSQYNLLGRIEAGDFTMEEVENSDLVMSSVAILNIIINVTSIVFFIMWFRRAYYNLSARTKPLRILVVGQTPPPHGGQAVMIEALLQGHYTSIRLFHVRMAFSTDMESVGKFALGKVLTLFTTIARVAWARFRFGARILYYPPSGPNKVPVLRDIALLCATRWLFSKTVFHFHAGGVSGFASQLPGLLRPLFRMAYGSPDLAIRTAEQNPDDGAALGARRCTVVPNDIVDARGSIPEDLTRNGEPLEVLFVGVLVESKGVRVLLEAFAKLVACGVDGRLRIMGRWNEEPRLW